MESIELFTGGGGLALGTHRAGFRHRVLMEWNSDACDTLLRNVERSRQGKLPSLAPISHWSVHHADIREKIREGFFDEFESGNMDLVAGGVPCQPFSLGGRHRAHADNRDMFPEFVKVIAAVRPKAFVVENVRGLLRKSFSTYFQYVLLRLSYPEISAKPDETWREHLHRLEEMRTSGAMAPLRYNVVFELLNAADYGVPQRRERVFIVGFRADTAVEWHFPSPTHSREALAHEQFVSMAYWDRHGLKPVKSARPWFSERQIAALGADAAIEAKPWRTVRDAISDLPRPSEQPSLLVPNHLRRDGARTYPGHTGSPVDLPSKTLKAGVHGVPGGENMLVWPNGKVRYYTVREAARMQTFPDDWVFEGAWSEAMRQLGNAVPMKLAEVVASGVACALEGKK